MSYLGETTLWALMVLIGAGNFLIRFSFMYLLGRVSRLSPTLERWLRYIPAAVLPALVAPAILVPGGHWVSLGEPRLWAGAIACVVALRTGSMVGTIISGMGAMWLLRWLLG